MESTLFTPATALIGGVMIGAAAVLLMATAGRIAGISGMVSRVLPPVTDSEAMGRVAFVAGLLFGVPFFQLAVAQPVAHTVTDNTPLVLAAGALVGFGAVLGSGCTSGHGVCGMSRVSPRSIAATLVFMATAAATVFVARHILGGA